ncbi:MAG: DUF262 domain-containing protein [Armatimonadetes bacterium]|nr:DUF262 domain-containing protein [Armatimonadota bacterium]
MSTQANRLTPTTKSVDDLYQLYADGRLDLNPDYQRNSVWPPKARAYLVDTILMDRPIPMLFLFKYRDSNSGRMHYRVIDGQQRIRAAFAYLENRFSTTESKVDRFAKKRFRKLDKDDQDQFMAYSFVVMELLGFNESELRDIFARINRYVVRLSPQELRDAEHPGPFKAYVDDASADSIWGDMKLFTPSQVKRKKDKEIVAELTILMLEGPQDKKGSVDLYYLADEQQFDEASSIKARLLDTVAVARCLVPSGKSMYLKFPAFYALMGSLFNLIDGDPEHQRRIAGSVAVADALVRFERAVQSLPADLRQAAELAKTNPEIGPAFQFLTATRSQTDNVRPRTQAIGVLQKLIQESLEIGA